MSNYVPPTQGQQQPGPPSARRIDPSAIFVEQPLRPQPGIDYLRQALGFNIKYGALAVILAILAYSLAAKTGRSFVFGTLLFASLSLGGYFLLGFMENIFEASSGHVVRSFFGWLVLRADIESAERIQYMHYKAEWMRLENERLQIETTQMQIRAQVERHGQPQGEFNRLTNYAPEEEGETGRQETGRQETGRQGDRRQGDRRQGDEARKILLDFLADLYGDQADTIKPDGTLRKEVLVPWSDSSEIARPVKRQMLDLIKQTEPRLLYQSGTRPWRLNIEVYPTVEDAIEALDTSVLRDV